MSKYYIRIKPEMYPFKLHVLLNYATLDELKADISLKNKYHTNNLHRIIDELDWDNAHGYTWGYKGHIFVVVKFFNKNLHSFDTLHHELVHAMSYCADYIGVVWTKESEEFYAYLNGYITRKIYMEIF
jgi:hypothetical protein